MSKRITEVNGIKVLRRYSAGNIFSGLICLGLVAIFILLLVTPWMFINLDGGARVQLTMLDMIKNLSTNTLNELEVEGVKALVNLILSYVIVVLYFFMGVIAVVVLFLGLEFLFRGKIGHFKLPTVLSVCNFIFMCVMMICAIAINFIATSSFVPGNCNAKSFELFPVYIYAAVTVLAAILLGVIYATSFKNRVFIGDLGDLKHFTGDAELDEKGQIRYQTKEVVKVKYEPAIGLPSRLSSIGGHAFSQNLNLKIAMIPMGIKSLGQGAFANCGRLEIVAIPLSVKSIGYNCFFNCVSLKRINYAGTKEQWRHVKRGSNWLSKAGTYTVVCADGAIVVNPYH